MNPLEIGIEASRTLHAMVGGEATPWKIWKSSWILISNTVENHKTFENTNQMQLHVNSQTLQLHLQPLQPPQRLIVTAPASKNPSGQEFLCLWPPICQWAVHKSRTVLQLCEIRLVLASNIHMSCFTTSISIFWLATCTTHLQPKSPLVHFVHSHLVYLWLCPEMEPKNSQKLLGKLIININDKPRDFEVPHGNFRQKPIWIGHDRAKKIARPESQDLLWCCFQALQYLCPGWCWGRNESGA